MAPRLATVRRPPPRREPPRQEKVQIKVEAKTKEVNPDDKEYKYDHATGGMMEVDPNRHHNHYPSCDNLTRVAKCVYCEKVKDKAAMRCLGQNFKEKGSLRYVWACKGCNPTNPAWQKISKQYKFEKHIMRMWNYDLAADKPIKIPEDTALAVGRQIVEKRRAQVDEDLAKALSKRKQKRVAENKAKFVEKFAKPKAKEVPSAGRKAVRSAKRRGRSFTFKRSS